MATYDELLLASENGPLGNRIRVACVIAAEAIRTEAGATANHANRLIWAKAVFANPQHESARMLWAVLAQNKTFTLAQITGATDTAIQTAVNTAVDVFATGV
jgi:hypothetical protein